MITNIQDWKDGKDAHKYRLLQAAAILKLFKEATGHDASSTEELNEWGAVNLKGPIDPSAVFSDEEMATEMDRIDAITKKEG